PAPGRLTGGDPRRRQGDEPGLVQLTGHALDLALAPQARLLAGRLPADGEPDPLPDVRDPVRPDRPAGVAGEVTFRYSVWVGPSTACPRPVATPRGRAGAPGGRHPPGCGPCRRGCRRSRNW